MAREHASGNQQPGEKQRVQRGDGARHRFETERCEQQHAGEKNREEGRFADADGVPQREIARDDAAEVEQGDAKDRHESRRGDIGEYDRGGCVRRESLLANEKSHRRREHTTNGIEYADARTQNRSRRRNTAVHPAPDHAHVTAHSARERIRLRVGRMKEFKLQCLTDTS